jgi:hypothetical protein
MRGRFVVLVVGSIFCLSLRAQADNVFAACQAQAVARDGWKAVCTAGWVLSLSDGRGDLAVEELLGALEEGLVTATKGTVIRERGQVDLPAKAWTVTRLQVKDAKEPGPTFALVGAGKLPGGTRVVSCTGLSENEGACKRAMQAAARTAWRSGPPAALPRDQAGPMFAGRAYPVPKGCEVVKQENAIAIGCQGEPVLFWSQQPEAFATLDSMMARNILGSGMKEVTPVPCSIDGVSTKCRSFMPKAATEPRSAFLAQATVRSQPVMVVCLAGASTRSLPPACAAVLSLAPLKP